MDGPQKWNVEHKSNIKKKVPCPRNGQCCSECSGCWFPLGVKGLKEDRQGLPGTGDVLFLEPGVGYTGVFTL